MNSLFVTIHFWDGTTKTFESELASGVDILNPKIREYILDEIQYDEGINLNDVRLIQTQFNDIKKSLNE